MPDTPLTRDHVIWAYRLLLDREPEAEQAIAGKLVGCRTTRDLRAEIVTSAEYRTKNPDFAQANERTIVIVDRHGIRLLVDLADHAVGLPIVRGRYEEPELRFVQSVLRPGDVAVDAGAHVGFFALHMASLVGRTGHVYAFEPMAENAELLERGVEENRFHDRLTVDRRALGSVTGPAVLSFATETLNRGGAFVLPFGAAPPADLAHRVVETLRLDEYPCRRPVRFVKMDVEGAEPLVLEGADRLLCEDRPALLLELHASQLQRVSGRTAAVLFRELRDRRYRPYALRDDGAPNPLDTVPVVPVTTVAFLPEEWPLQDGCPPDPPTA
jgi:FkbM family methyltransferase